MSYEAPWMLSAILALGGCLAAPQPPEAPEADVRAEALSPPAPYDSTVAAIHEAVFRHQLEHAEHASGYKRDDAAYFLCVLGEDPPGELLQRFEGHQPPIGPSSEFKQGPGLKLFIGTLTWANESTVEVLGGYAYSEKWVDDDGRHYEALYSCVGRRYRIVQRVGAWIVEEDRWESVY